MTRPGQRDLSACRLTRHALERFVERFGGSPEGAEPRAARFALARTRRLGRNAQTERLPCWPFTARRCWWPSFRTTPA